MAKPTKEQKKCQLQIDSLAVCTWRDFGAGRSFLNMKTVVYFAIFCLIEYAAGEYGSVS